MNYNNNITGSSSSSSSSITLSVSDVNSSVGTHHHHYHHQDAHAHFESIHLWMTAIGVVGVFSNLVALFILTKSKRIRCGQSYVLLMNQSLIDFTCSTHTFVWLAVWFTGRPDNKVTGNASDWFECAIVRTQFMIAWSTCSSSYNLAVLSLERMFSVVKPIAHRVGFNRANQKLVSVAVWALGAAVMLGFNVPTNGVDPATGRCYFWSRFPSRSHAHAYAVTLVLLYNVLPVAVMVGSYAAIYAKLGDFGRGVAGSAHVVKTNVVKTLATCVIAYIGCHTLRSTLSLAARFGHSGAMLGGLYQLGMMLMQVNSIVNPFIYMLQFKDYRVELWRQLARCGARCGVRHVAVRPVTGADHLASTFTNSSDTPTVT